jgi:hypothetical protein
MSALDPCLNPEAGKKLNEYLRKLRLPAIRRTFGEKASPYPILPSHCLPWSSSPFLPSAA